MDALLFKRKANFIIRKGNLNENDSMKYIRTRKRTLSIQQRHALAIGTSSGDSVHVGMKQINLLERMTFFSL